MRALYAADTRVLDPKQWSGHVRCDQTRNCFGGINSCIKRTPMLIFATGRVWQRKWRETIKTHFTILFDTPINFAQLLMTINLVN